ncbi:MAG TPA: bifunctional adenosylcobinamide kinase/adenosylcobinamide-phosphate guanylyltransferase [Pedococcus sp.]|jgi:adenosylcobinamide kinase/adenosylcobinamide-phosphate guanylyltransferase|nr:bifunctional adenosylcobinamide kinase/adenosylcobinamide-phosphate guanylyltransferase [Pedococcus sp.]
MKTLVTGGVRSGKSMVAEHLLAGADEVSYLATGPCSDDADWAERVAAHRNRRPAHWSTVETSDLATALAQLTGPALVDCLGTWLTATLDDLQVWEAPQPTWEAALSLRLQAVVDAWTTCPHGLVAVTNEVGWGVVPEHRSGRIFADWLGRLNQQVAAASDRVLLVVSGQVLVVKQP